MTGPTYAPTVASTQPTVQATETPSALPKTITVETKSPPYQYMPLDNGKQARVSHPRYYRTDDWTMPVPAPDSLKPATHGIINEMDFWNPEDSSVNISVYNLKTAFYENKTVPSKFLTSYEMFYDDKQGFFSEFTLAPSERRTVQMYSYIMDDSLYDQYRGYIVEPVSVALIPQTPYT